MMTIDVIGPVDRPAFSRPVYRSRPVATSRDAAWRRRQSAMTRARRGVATMLVVCGTAAAVIVVAAYVVGRQDAPRVGDNMISGAEARFAAETGIDLAVAVMEDPGLNWRTAHVGGVLIDEYDFGPGSISVSLIDLEGNVPTAETEYAVMIATGDCGGLRQSAAASVYQPVPSTEVDVDLSEFAIFASQSIGVTNNGVVTRWKRAPKSTLGEPIRLATTSTAAGAVNVSSGGKVIDGQLFARGDAAAGVLANTVGAAGALDRVNVTNNQSLPFPAAPTPLTLGILNSLTPNPVVTSSWVVGTSRRYQNVTVDTGGLLAFASDGLTNVITGDLELDDGGRMTIDKRINLVVQGNVRVLDDAAIEILDGGALNLWVGGDLRIDGGIVGMPVANVRAYASRRAMSDADVYASPEHFACYKLPGSAAGTRWEVRNRGFACGRFHAKDCDVMIDGEAAIFGHVAARRVEVKNQSALFYDHQLDRGLGYSNPASRLFSGERSLRTTITLAATSLDATVLATLNTLAAALGAADPKPVEDRLIHVGMQTASVEEAPAANN